MKFKSYIGGLYEVFFKNNISFGLNLLVAKLDCMIHTKKTPLNILSSEKTIKHAIYNKKSILRWGDGDTRIALGGNMYYQKHSNKLQNELQSILKYTSDEPYLLCIPPDAIKK